MSPDPLLAALPSLDESIGDNLNLYAYAGNNPVARIDLTGFWGEELKAALQSSPLANAVAGFAYGVVQGMTPGGVAMPNPARDAPHGAVFQHWQGAGQVIGGGVGVAMNATTTLAAGAAEGPTLGAATPVLVVSAVGVANGVLAVQAGTKNIAEAQARGDSAASSGPPRSPSSSSTPAAKAIKVEGPATAASKKAVSPAEDLAKELGRKPTKKELANYVNKLNQQAGNASSGPSRAAQGGGQVRGGHSSGARGSTQQKHEKGDTRRARDQGGEKGDERRQY